MWLIGLLTYLLTLHGPPSFLFFKFFVAVEQGPYQPYRLGANYGKTREPLYEEMTNDMHPFLCFSFTAWGVCSRSWLKP